MWPYLMNFEATHLEFVIQIQSECIEFLPGAFTSIFLLNSLSYTTILGSRHCHTYFVDE